MLCRRTCFSNSVFYFGKQFLLVLTSWICNAQFCCQIRDLGGGVEFT